MNPQPDFRIDNRLRGNLPILVNLVILALWTWLFRPVYAYLGILFTRQEFRTNQIVLLAVLVLIILQVRRGSFRFSLFEKPQLHWPGLLLSLSGAAAFIAAEHWLDINTLSASLFGLASYGLLGLWMDPLAWRQGLPAGLLLIGVLPFGEHLDTFIGYPLRLLTARIVSQGLVGLGVPHLGIDTILVFENGLSQVDNPCSGVKSLWSGGLFLLAATWVDQHPINRRWLLSTFGFVLLLLGANLARVAILVLVGQVAGWRLVAEMLHVPLGVIGFVAACLAGLGLLRWAGSRSRPPAVSLQASPRPAWLAPTLAMIILSLVFLYSPRSQPASAAGSQWSFPAELMLQEWPLDEVEMAWLTDHGALSMIASRWRFEWQGLHGSMLFISSNTWRAHHRPESCFTVYGLEVKQSQPYLVAPDFPLRWVSIGDSHADSLFTNAAYWLQSSQRVTEDYSVRIWDDFSPNPETWVLSTVLFDAPVDPESPELGALLITLRQSIQQGLDTLNP